jgi:hypothetical protein
MTNVSESNVQNETALKGESSATTAKKLNPNAKEFVFNAKAPEFKPSFMSNPVIPTSGHYMGTAGRTVPGAVNPNIIPNRNSPSPFNPNMTPNARPNMMTGPPGTGASTPVYAQAMMPMPPNDALPIMVTHLPPAPVLGECYPYIIHQCLNRDLNKTIRMTLQEERGLLLKI